LARVWRFRTATAAGFRIVLQPPGNLTEDHFAAHGRFPEEASMAALAADLAGRRALFLDIGANAGVFTLKIAPLLAPGGRVMAFEPGREMRRRLEANLGLNRVRNVTVCPWALGEREETLTLSLPDWPEPNAGSATLRPIARAKARERVAVRSLLASLPADAASFDFIAAKLDVEGWEDRVLVPFFRDAPPALWPRVLMIEIMHEDAWQSDLAAVLARSGYAAVRAINHNMLYRRG
jgi:FkbM family methyltransferase